MVCPAALQQVYAAAQTRTWPCGALVRAAWRLTAPCLVQLKAQYPALDLPQPPARKFFRRSFDPLYIETKRSNLNKYIKALLAHPVLGKSKELSAFLSNVPLVRLARRPGAARSLIHSACMVAL